MRKLITLCLAGFKEYVADSVVKLYWYVLVACMANYISILVNKVK